MHTATQLREDLFALTYRGESATRADLLPNWGPFDRLGVVVTEPFGGVGASHLIQLAITAFYDDRPERRDATGPHAMYPEIYLFHVGGPHGDHSAYDFWPSRREVHVDRDARAVLDAVNDRGITRLAVPDGSSVPVEHDLFETAVATQRMTTALAYSPTGRVRDPHWAVAGLNESTEANVHLVLDPAARLARSRLSARPTDPDLDVRSWPHRVVERLDEAAPGLAQARHRRDALRDEAGLVEETYRSISVDEALAMLI